MRSNLPIPARALAVAAHPDDVEFGCGGTLAKWAASGCEIFHLVCTDGSKGSWDPAQDPAELVVTRRREQRSASVALGGKGEVTFLGWPDGELESGLRQRFEVAACIRRLKPDVVLGHDPWKRYRLHPDHRNAGFLVTDGIVAARDPLFFPELGDAAAPAVDLAPLRGGRGRSSRGRDAVSSTRSWRRCWSIGASSAPRWGSPTRMPPETETTAAARTLRLSSSSAGLLDRLAEHGRQGDFAAAEAFKRIDDH